MMGSQGAPAPVIDDLKNLLGLVSDPSRAKAALDEFAKAKAAADAAISLSEVRKSEADRAWAQAVQGSQQVQREKAALDLEKKKLSEKGAALDMTQKSLAESLAEFAAEKSEFYISKAKIIEGLVAEKSAADARHADLVKEESIVRVLREECEQKIAKLKAVVG